MSDKRLGWREPLAWVGIAALGWPVIALAVGLVVFVISRST